MFTRGNDKNYAHWHQRCKNISIYLCMHLVGVYHLRIDSHRRQTKPSTQSQNCPLESSDLCGLPQYASSRLSFGTSGYVRFARGSYTADISLLTYTAKCTRFYTTTGVLFYLFERINRAVYPDTRQTWTHLGDGGPLTWKTQ